SPPGAGMAGVPSGGGVAAAAAADQRRDAAGADPQRLARGGSAGSGARGTVLGTEDAAGEGDEAIAALLEVLELVVGRCPGGEDHRVETLEALGECRHSVLKVGCFDDLDRGRGRTGSLGEAGAGDRQ